MTKVVTTNRRWRSLAAAISLQPKTTAFEERSLFSFGDIRKAIALPINKSDRYLTLIRLILSSLLDLLHS
ncbi:hypothetical protein [Okeania sp. KiyG1]|uniref:hypothetical protein n=1 Tax=Okeania sp. KiyG1 TaxID=2720165 RepID=UPI0019220E88|nr:hypothetical protein [Okeania sp. KiyG1]